MSGEVGENAPVRKLTQFARQAQYLSERENPYYSSSFKAVMRYVPLAMRLYRAKHYCDMESDWSGFPIDSGAAIRSGLAKENEAYVKRTAPKKYWNALIPKSEIGCKRKVLDTEYLKCLWRDNVELISNDPVQRITGEGVITSSGREIHADAIVLATGFATQQMLCPMEIIGRDGLKLNDYVSDLPTFQRSDCRTDRLCSGTTRPRGLHKPTSVPWSLIFLTSSSSWGRILSLATLASSIPSNARSTLHCACSNQL